MPLPKGKKNPDRLWTLFGPQRQAMRSNRVLGGRSHDCDRKREKFVVKQLEGEVMPGDCIWAKLRRNMWWPAVVVDENTVSECNKPCKRASGVILVRLYGSYEYLYVDPIKYHTEFQKVLKLNDGSYSKLFENALEQELSHLKSGSSKGKRSKSTGKYKSNRPSADEEVKCKYSELGSRHKKLKPNNTSDEERRTIKMSMEGEDTKKKTPKQHEKHNPNSPNSETGLLRTSHELSARRLRVMQSLGLIAPSGSPFSKSEQISVSS